MLKILKERWAENEAALRKAISEISNVYDIKYEDLVKLTFSKIYDEIDNKSITVIDNGYYQGTLLFIMPFNIDSPNEADYLMTYIGYGSCSVCDTLKEIKDCDYEYYDDEDCDDEEHRPTEKQTEDLLALCRDIMMHTIKPYNDGWRRNENFVTVEFDG